MTAILTQLRQLAANEGFIACGVAPAVDATGFTQLCEWIDAGYAGEMQYFTDRRDAYRHPSSVLAGTKSILALAYPYTAAAEPVVPVGTGRVARYAHSGTDYHDIIHPKLKRLCRLIQELAPEAQSRGVVDTAPLMEREIAQVAGLGWRGKNTLLLNKHFGSYFFLACVLTTLELPCDQPHETSHCGTCTACLDACPTNAFPTAGVLDATRCISYLTIEHHAPIDESLRAGIGDWVFGCDICQEVCPWNRKPARRESPETPDLPAFDRLSLPELFSLDEDAFRARFRKTPLWRTRRRGVLRNAAIVLGNGQKLGNQTDSSAVAALTIGIKDADAMIRQTSAWALGRIATIPAIAALKAAIEVETDAATKDEMRRAIHARASQQSESNTAD